MSFAMEDAEAPARSSKKSAAGGFVLFGLLFLPATLLATGVYMLLRKGRQRLSVIATVCLLIMLAAAAVFFWGDAWPRTLETIQQWETFLDGGWQGLIPLAVVVNLALGALAGFIVCVAEVHQMKVNPHRLRIPGNWMYGFKYRRTPLQLLKRKRTIKGLKDGWFSQNDKAPLGLDETHEDSVTYRYDTEAAKMTLVSGASGSGKALHKDEPIPTPTGMATVGSLGVGDVIFDEQGQPTRILGKYQPLTEDHYKVVFSDGTTIRACGDHLWEVHDSTQSEPQHKFAGEPLFSDAVLKTLKSIPASDKSEITLQEAVRLFSPTSEGAVRAILGGVTPLYKPNHSIYKRASFLSVLSSVKGSSESLSRARDVTAFLQSGESEFVGRDELVHLAPRTLLSRWAFSVEKRFDREAVYTLGDVVQALLRAEESRRRPRKPRRKRVLTLSTRELLASGLRDRHGKKRYTIPLVSAPVAYAEQTLLVDPYTLGAWLGDGNSRNGDICGADKEVAYQVAKSYPLHREVKDSRNPNGRALYNWTFTGLKRDLDSLGLLQKSTWEGSQKDIPHEYLISSEDQRLSLLAGLLDTDGSAAQDGTVEIGLTNKQVVEKIKQVVQSLGWKTTRLYSKVPRLTKDDGTVVEGKPCYSFSFRPTKQVFRHLAKAARLQARFDRNLSQQSRHQSRYITAIEPIQDSPGNYYCFEVDAPSHLFLCTEAFIPTHNTITLLSLILADIQSGKPSFVLDFKRSPEMAAKLAAWCKENDVEFYHFVNGPPDEYDVKDSFGQCTYDPLGTGSPTSKADMVLNMREWDTASAIYRTNNQQLLQIVFSMLNQADRNSPALHGEVPYDGAGRRILNMDEFLERSRTKTLVKRGYSEHMASGGEREGFSALSYLQQVGEYRMEVESFIDWKSGGIYQLYSALRNTETLKALCTACGETPIEQQAEELKALLISKEGGGIRAALSEIQGQMRTIVASDYGRWMKTGGEERSIDLLTLSQKPNVLVLFSLNSDSEPDFARYVGSMILSDFTALSAKRRNVGAKNLINIYVDEFQAVPPTSVTSLLEKARESRMALTLAQQSFEQIIASSDRNGEAYLLSILDTCSNFIVHNGMTEDSATRLSKILGKHHETIYRQANQNQSFFLSMNWANRRNQMVHTAEEERWIFEPRRFMSLSSPDKNNGFKATAVLVNKTSADPRFKGREGALARTVWMLPNSKVIGEYYTPTFRDAGERAMEAAPVSEPLEETQISLKSPAMLSFQPYSVEEDEPTFYDEEEPVAESYRSDEEEDGSFGWSMDQEDAQEPEGLLDASPLPAHAPQQEERGLPQTTGGLPTFSSPPPQRASQEPRRRAVTDLFSQDFKPQRLKDLQEVAPVSTPAPTPAAEEKSTGLPQLPPQQGGLPKLPPLPPRTGGLPRLPGV